MCLKSVSFTQNDYLGVRHLEIDSIKEQWFHNNGLQEVVTSIHVVKI